MTVEQLDSAVAKRLLQSTIPARLAFVGARGDPRVAPIWFLWRDDRIVMCSQSGAAKVKAIRAHPQVAISIDSATVPYDSLRVRGRADIEMVEGIADDYVSCARRYYGEVLGNRWIEFVRPFTERMAVISVRPEWVEAWDFRERFPDLFAGMARDGSASASSR